MLVVVEAVLSVHGFVNSLHVSSTILIYVDVCEGASRCKLDSHDFGLIVFCVVNAGDVSFCFTGSIFGTMTVGIGTEIVAGAEVGDTVEAAPAVAVAVKEQGVIIGGGGGAGNNGDVDEGGGTDDITDVVINGAVDKTPFSIFILAVASVNFCN